jgi:hypothetical protein
MQKKLEISILLIILLVIPMFTVFATTSRPNLVISKIRFVDERTGVFYPEIAVDSDGTWREATIHDIWIGQKFKLFMDLDEKSKSINNNFSIVVSKIDDLPAEFQSQNQIEKEGWYFGTFYNKPVFANKGIGKLIKPEPVNPKIKDDYTQLPQTQTNRKLTLEKIVKLDWVNIKKDFPKLMSQNIESYVTGDINGDGRKDYILILGENTFGSQNSGPAAVIIYLNNHGKMERVPVSFWKGTSDLTSFPQLLFTKDFNGDKAEELFISDSNTDSQIPIVYSWFKDKNGSWFKDDSGLMLIYYGENEFWQG